MALYLDYNSSAPVNHEVLDEMIEVYKNNYGNPDSRTHQFGTEARKIVENSRKQVAELIGSKPDEVIFTSGATESNNMVLKGLMKYAKESGKNHIISSSVEHKSILETLNFLQSEGFEVTLIDPDPDGRVDPIKIEGAIKSNTLLVALMHVNNETGMIQPVEEIGKFLKEKQVFFLIDATQSIGKLDDEISLLDFDFLTFSGHKLGAPQGIGALVMKKKEFRFPPLTPLLHGGGQEFGLRSGTVPTALVAGLGKACELANRNRSMNRKLLKERSELLFKRLRESNLNYHVNGNPDFLIPNTANISFDGVSSEGLMILLKGICGISNGSACTAKDYTTSYVLRNMHLPNDQVEEAVRFSWGPETDLNEFDQALLKTIDLISQFQ